MAPEWIHPAIELLDEIIAQIEAGTACEKIQQRLVDELRPLVVALAALDPRD